MMKISFLLLVLLLVPFLSFAKESISSVCDETDGSCVNSNLYRDAAVLLDVAMHIYGYSCMRELAIEFPDNFTDIRTVIHNHMRPIDATNIITFARDNKDTILAINEAYGDKYISLESSGSFHHLWNKAQWKQGDATVALDTEKQEEELVYGIAVDHVHKRVIVAFRGSETKKNWLTNAKVNYKRVRNPHYEDKENQPEYIRLHTGFHDYLLDKRLLSDRPIKYDSIKGELAKVLKENPGYQLYVTGHSLGGALSTIFTFFIASESEIDNNVEIPKPVTLISFAAPLVGDETWQTAFQYLEKDGTVQHLRVSNLEDLVPTIPISSLFPLDWGRDYKHTGINLKLFENRTTELKHSYKMDTRPTEDTKSVSETLPWHTLSMYDIRLDEVADQLDGLQLAELYKDPEVLGPFATFE